MKDVVVTSFTGKNLIEEALSQVGSKASHLMTGLTVTRHAMLVVLGADDAVYRCRIQQPATLENCGSEQ